MQLEFGSVMMTEKLFDALKIPDASLALLYTCQDSGERKECPPGGPAERQSGLFCTSLVLCVTLFGNFTSIAFSVLLPNFRDV